MLFLKTDVRKFVMLILEQLKDGGCVHMQKKNDRIMYLIYMWKKRKDFANTEKGIFKLDKPLKC